MGDLREPNGVVLEESPVTSSSSSSNSTVGREVWDRAEAATQQIIRQVQPTVVSEKRRRDVIDYVKRLLKRCLGCEVFPFGSVPLKTYLPDGDIDLTAFCGLNFEEAFANDVFSVLRAEDGNPHAELVVKDVQYIRAEVKLVKCLVQNIVVDISFNQIGGLCALCFLEEVDRLIGKDHLFKRSIILIKAWCYYESRILGAHHGLISTYALETLVLFIFHLFHSSLNGPLAVLHKFLDYFSKFDWDSFCVTLSGPVVLASLPEIAVEKPETSGGDLLLSETFMRECVRKFSIPSKGAEMNYRTFIQKHLNIVDPLKENNNLGRSVSRGNFFRIRSAFSYGARKLGHILGQPQDILADEVRKFFTNTLDRHGKGQRPDVLDYPILSSCNGFPSERSISLLEPCQYQIYTHEVDSVYAHNQSSEGSVISDDKKEAIVSKSSESDIEGILLENRQGVRKPSLGTLEVELPKDEPLASASRLIGDTDELATNGVKDLRITGQGDDVYSFMAVDRKLPSGDAAHAPDIYLSHHLENGVMENGFLDEEQHMESSLTCTNPDAGHSHKKVNGYMSSGHDDSSISYNDGHNYTRYSSVDGDAHSLQGSQLIYQSCNHFPDLSGDIDCHLDNLHYGRWWYDQGLTMPIQPMHLIPPPLYPAKHPWDAIHQAVHSRQEAVPQMNGVVPRPAFYPTNPPVSHYMDEMPKSRGLGTYFPIMNYHSYRDRPSPKGRYQGQLKSPRTNGRGPAPLDRSSQVQSPGRQGNGRPKFSDNNESSPRGKVFREANGFVHFSEKASEYGPSRPTPLEVALPEAENSRPPDSDPSPGSENVEPIFVVDESRLSIQSYRLKDDDDFPPLSG